MRPRLIQVPLDQEATEGSNITVNCEATGFPLPNITWNLDTSPLQVSPRHRVCTFIYIIFIALLRHFP